MADLGILFLIQRLNDRLKSRDTDSLASMGTTFSEMKSGATDMPLQLGALYPLYEDYLLMSRTKTNRRTGRE